MLPSYIQAIREAVSDLREPDARRDSFRLAIADDLSALADALEREAESATPWPGEIACYTCKRTGVPMTYTQLQSGVNVVVCLDCGQPND